MTLSCSTKVCSFGNQVVEKLESERASYESDGKYVYRFENSPMCEYMVTFINKLKQLPEKHLKNSVLENFSVLQVISFIFFKLQTSSMILNGSYKKYFDILMSKNVKMKLHINFLFCNYEQNKLD